MKHANVTLGGKMTETAPGVLVTPTEGLTTTGPDREVNGYG